MAHEPHQEHPAPAQKPAHETLHDEVKEAEKTLRKEAGDNKPEPDEDDKAGHTGKV